MSEFTSATWEKVTGKKVEGRQVYRIRGPAGDGFRFYIGTRATGLAIHVPEGFETDGPSIPGWAKWLVPSSAVERVMKASAVHDLLCEDENFKRPDADGQFWVAMSAEGTPEFWRWVFFNAVITNGNKDRLNTTIRFDDEVSPGVPISNK